MGPLSLKTWQRKWHSCPQQCRFCIIYQMLILKAKEDSRKVCCLSEYQSLPTLSQTEFLKCTGLIHGLIHGDFSPPKSAGVWDLWIFPMVSHFLRNSCKEVKNISNFSLPQYLHNGCSWHSSPLLPTCAHVGDALQHKLCPKPWTLQWGITLMARSWPLCVACAVKQAG